MTQQWTAREFEMITGLPSYADNPPVWSASSAPTVKPSTSARFRARKTQDKKETGK